jgi:hypothetical protein
MYIVLASDHCARYFADNRASNFTNFIDPPLTLYTNQTLALLSIGFTGDGPPKPYIVHCRIVAPGVIADTRSRFVGVYLPGQAERAAVPQPVAPGMIDSIQIRLTDLVDNEITLSGTTIVCLDLT